MQKTILSGGLGSQNSSAKIKLMEERGVWRCMISNSNWHGT